MTSIERELVDLADHLDLAPADDLSLRVVARLREGPAASRPRRRRVVLLAALVGVLLVASLAPAVADWLGAGGVEVRQEPPPQPPSSLGLRHDLGRAVTVADARRAAAFEPLVPSALGRPDETWLDQRRAVPVVSFVYVGGPLVMEFRGSIDREALFTKFAGPGVRVEELAVDGARALWVEGVHGIAVRAGGAVEFDRLRVSDSALLVERDGITVRIETTRGRDAAVAWARNLVPLGGVEEP